MIRVLIRVSGYSRQQITRLIAQYRKTGTLRRRQRTVAGFTRSPALCSPCGPAGTVEKISEYYLIPILEQLLEAFPFRVLGFHSDNGSEYTNKRVAAPLDKPLIEFTPTKRGLSTKSCSRQSHDNALAESKNGSVVRKIFGYSHIPSRFAQRIHLFNQEVLNPYVNYHRPCFFPETHTDAKGRQRNRYRYEAMMTPYDKLKSLPGAEAYLKPGLSFAILDQIAYALSDNQAADRLQKARQKLFHTLREQNLKSG